MSTFQHFATELRVHSGPGCLSGLERELGRLGCQRAVVVTGDWLAQGPLLDKVRQALDGRLAGVSEGVIAHSPRKSVVAIAEELAGFGADAVIAVGGGSSVVSARGATIALAEGDDFESLCTKFDADGRPRSPRLPAAKLPQFIIPTTPTTAMVKAGTAIADPDTGARYALFDPKTRATALFVDPDFLMGTPQPLVASAALDSLSLAIEGLCSISTDPLANASLIHAIRLLSGGLRNLASNDSDELRSELVYGAVLAGRGTDHAGAGVATALGHAIGAAFHAENGIVKATLLPHALRFNAEHLGHRLPLLATAFGADGVGNNVIEAIIAVAGKSLRDHRIPLRLREFGVEQADLPVIAERALNDWFLRGNPRPVKAAEELVGLLQTAW